MAVDAAIRIGGIKAEGEYLGAEQQRDTTKPAADGSGTVTYRGRFVVKLLVGDRVIPIEYKDKDEADSRIGEAGYEAASLERGDWLVLPIGIRSSKGYTFYFGR